MVYHTIEYNGRYYAGKGSDDKSAHSDACTRLIVEAIVKYARENYVYPEFTEIPKYKQLKIFVHSIYYIVLKQYMSGNEEIVELSIKYNGRTYLGTGTSCFKAKYNACLNAAKVVIGSVSVGRMGFSSITNYSLRKYAPNPSGNPRQSAPKKTDFLTSYPDYKSYESFEQNKASKRLPHPSDILTVVLNVKPIFRNVRVLGDACMYYTRVGTREYMGESSFESALSAVLAVCKDPDKMTKLESYMSSLKDSKTEDQVIEPPTSNE